MCVCVCGCISVNSLIFLANDVLIIGFSNIYPLITNHLPPAPARPPVDPSVRLCKCSIKDHSPPIQNASVFKVWNGVDEEKMEDSNYNAPLRRSSLIPAGVLAAVLARCVGWGVSRLRGGEREVLQKISSHPFFMSRLNGPTRGGKAASQLSVNFHSTAHISLGPPGADTYYAPQLQVSCQWCVWNQSNERGMVCDTIPTSARGQRRPRLRSA